MTCHAMLCKTAIPALHHSCGEREHDHAEDRGLRLNQAEASFHVIPFSVLICAQASYFVNILDCQHAVLWLNYCCTTADYVNVISPITKQYFYECTVLRSSKNLWSCCMFPIMLVYHTQKCSVYECV